MVINNPLATKRRLYLKRKKSLVYSLVILLVLATFVAGYFFYYIPRNTETVQGNGFLILETISANIKDKVAGHANFYKNVYTTGRNKAGMQELLQENNIKATIGYFSSQQMAGKTISAQNSQKDDQAIEATVRIEQTHFVYSFRNTLKGDSVNFREPIATFLEPILKPQRKELFISYAVVLVNKENSRIIYNDETIGIRSDINLDTLFPRSIKAYFSGIADVNSEDYNHKMFYYPFHLESFQLVLTGFIPADQYSTKTRHVPFGFVYPLTILFVLLLVFMPIIKFKVMDSNEQVKVVDIFLFGLSAFFGVSVLTLIIVQILLWKGEEERVFENIESLSAQIEKNFSAELCDAYDMLVRLDEFRKKDSAGKTTLGREVDYRERIRHYLKQINSSPQYYHFDRISWVDTANGKQVRKAEIYGRPVFTNVKERNYYKSLINGDPLVLKRDTKELKFGWEPIYSWTNADFNISFSILSDEYMAVLATKMHSVVNAVLPVGYGFCIIDQEGNVQVHSDMNRNLMENFFRKAKPSKKLISMIAGRQEGFMNDVNLYGKLHILGVRPVKDLPYSIVTFYDKGFIIPVNMRIIIFAFFFSMISGLISILLLILLSKVAFKHPLVYSPMDFLSWLPPKQREKNFYFHGLLFLIAYIIMLLGMAYLHNSMEVSNYTIFSIVFLTPINIILGLYVLSEAFNHVNQQESVDAASRQRLSFSEVFRPKFNAVLIEGRPYAVAKSNVKVYYVLIAHLFISTIYYSYARSYDFNIHFLFALVQLVVNAWMWAYVFLSNRPAAFFTLKESTRGYRKLSRFFGFRRSYNLMATFLVISLSVLPSAMYIWYAHNQEIVQSVKKHQLHLANSIRERSAELSKRNGFDDTDFIPRSYLTQLIFEKGIYTIHNDSIYYAVGIKGTGSRNLRPFDKFYFSITDKIGNAYYDPHSYPALQDKATDSGWSWQVVDSVKRIHLSYNLPTSFSKTMHIVSNLPQRFKYLTGERIGWLFPFGLFLFLLALGLYQWLLINTKSIFLTNYLKKGKKKNVSTGNAQTLSASDALQQSRLVQHIDGLEEKWLTNKTCISQDSGHPVNIHPSRLTLLEKEILQKVRHCSDAFELIWKKCTEKEKYLIYDFASDGLINYKNTAEIYDLLSKGVFVVDSEKIRLFNAAFRAYVITKTDTDEIKSLQKKFKSDSTWETLRKPLVLVIFLVFMATFIFFTEEALFQKLLVLASGLGTVIAMLPKYTAEPEPKAAAPEAEEG